MSSAEKRFRRKIKTREELKEILGPRPREQKVVMCHGTFDLVHPGHVRHLMYAKSKADVLVASLTSDAFISKANYRPFVPQNLRAMNLAALEDVDYVIVDKQPTPLENIAYLQPDYFENPYDFFQTWTEADLTRSRQTLKYNPTFTLARGIDAYHASGQL